MKRKERRLPAQPKRSEEEEALVRKHQEKMKLSFPYIPEKGKIEDPVLFEAQLTEAAGTADRTVSFCLVAQVTSSLISIGKGPKRMNGAISLLYGIKPQDVMEGMLSAEMISTHELAMEFLRRAAASQTLKQVDANTNMATKLLRTYTAQMEALCRYRNRGQQRVVVEHVSVNAGGQAVVGIVEAQSGGRGGSGEN
jgi:hypothetical protein